MSSKPEVETLDNRRLSQAERSALADKRMFEVAVRLIVERGTEKTTLKDIGEMAGYSRGLATYHYGSKASLFRQVGRLTTEHWLNLLQTQVGQARGLSALLAAVDANRKFVTESPELIRAMFILCFEAVGPQAEIKEDMAHALRAQRRDAERWIEEGIVDGTIRETVDPARFAEQFVGSVYGYVYQWMMGPKDIVIGKMYAVFKRNIRSLIQIKKTDG